MGMNTIAPVMTLQQAWALLQPRIPAARLVGDGATPLARVHTDTRTLQPGDLFVALQAARDGHDFVAQALEKGAAAILCREPPRTGSWLSTPDPRAALARVSAAWFGYPGEEMTL